MNRNLSPNKVHVLLCKVRHKMFSSINLNNEPFAKKNCDRGIRCSKMSLVCQQTKWKLMNQVHVKLRNTVKLPNEMDDTCRVFSPNLYFEDNFLNFHQISGIHHICVIDTSGWL